MRSGNKPYHSSDALADVKIDDIAIRFPGYGYGRITAQLNCDDIHVNLKRVLRIIRHENILVKARKSFKAMTNSSHSLTRYPNLIKNLNIDRPDMVWNSDITYIRILTDFVYLATLIDGFSRYIGGYALGKTILPMLTIAALNEQYQKEIQMILFIIQTRAFSIAILTMCIF